MWVFTTDGFFSIVHNKHCSDEELSVRARSREDLGKFLKKSGHLIEIIEFSSADYRYRAQVPREVVAQYLSRQAMETNYGNFQEACLRSGFSMDRIGALNDIHAECRKSWKDD